MVSHHLCLGGIRLVLDLRQKMNQKPPKISIITPVFNNVRYIEDCILSVINQKYPNLEYIVIDGGSNDGTVQIIEKYASQLAYFISEKDQGQTQALNKGFVKATGDVFAWINADEEYLPDTLHRVGEAFLKAPNLDFYYGQRIIVNSEKREIGRKRWVSMHPKWHLLYRMSVLPTDASFWSARAHRLTGSLDEENFPRLSMDYDWLLRLSCNVKRWKRTSTYLSKYTERPDRVTQIGDAANPNIERTNNYFTRSRVIDNYQYSKAKLFFGWVAAGLCARIFEKRISFPHLLYSIKKLYRVE